MRKDGNKRLILFLLIVVLVMWGFYYFTHSAVPKKIGECSKTTIVEIGTRLEGDPNSGSYVKYANGIVQISYELIPGIETARIGDKINLCLVSIPSDCPPGDNRGKIYSALDEDSGHVWQASDSQHSCGGM